MNRKYKLIKDNQNLASWVSFYNDSMENLPVRRYHRILKTITDRVTRESRQIPIIPFAEYSLRLTQDRSKAKACLDQMKINNEEINKLNKKN